MQLISPKLLGIYLKIWEDDFFYILYKCVCVCTYSEYTYTQGSLVVAC